MVAKIQEAPMEEWMLNSRLVREWSEMKQEILRHKWLESERADEDIGWDRARASWMLRHRGGFTAARGTSAPQGEVGVRGAFAEAAGQHGEAQGDGEGEREVVNPVHGG